jgi:tripartite-type tricarboxylate transporter receptor subunit TctC
MLRNRCARLIAWLLGAIAATDAAAQAYPSRPIRLVIPFSPGGATDVPGRLIAQKLSDVFGHQIIIDNRPGAGSAMGSEIVEP